MRKEPLLKIVIIIAAMMHLEVVAGYSQSFKSIDGKGSNKTAYANNEERKAKERAKIMNSRPGRVNVAPEIGMNLNELNKLSDHGVLHPFASGIRVGAMANIGLGAGNVFALQPGLLYTLKTDERKSSALTGAGPIYATTNTTRQYLEVPVNIVYKFGDLVGQPRFMVGAGPYISYLINRRDKFRSTAGDENKVTKTNLDFNKPGYGIGGFVGYQMPRGFYVKAGIEMPLVDVMQYDLNNTSSGNYYYTASVGYIIGSKYKIY